MTGAIGPQRSKSRVVPDWMRNYVAESGASNVRRRLWLWRAPLVPGNRAGHWREPSDW